MDSGHTEDQPRTVTPQQVIAAARAYLGVRWVHQGRGRDGLDCIGLVIAVVADLGILPSDIHRRDYGRLPTGELITKVAEHCAPLERAELGCLILIRWPAEKEPGHAVLRTDRGIIHSYRNHEGVKEHGYRAKWPLWSHSFWRLPGVTGG